MDDDLPWNFWRDLNLDDGGYVPPSPEDVARDHAAREWWPQSPEDDANRRFQEWLKDFLCAEFGIGCHDPTSL